LPRGQRDVIFAGAYDPLRRSPPGRRAPVLRAALAPFGSVVVHDRGALCVGVVGIATEPTPGDDSPLLTVLDGYLTAPEELLDQEPERALGRRHVHQGPDFVATLQGAFSLLCWDEANERGLLARDQLGQRPLFLAERGAELYFATELRPLLDLLPTRPTPSDEAVVRFLAPSELREDLVLYEGIERLGNGDLVELADGRWTKRPYWRPTFRAPPPRTSADVVEEARAEIGAAVRRHLRGATRFGVLLSGGLDSSCVAAFALPALDADGRTLQAYSAVFPHVEPVDESRQIDAVVGHLGLPSTRLEVFAGSSVGSSLQALEAWAVPSLTGNGFFFRHLGGQAVEDGIEVMLGGEGGDEVFAAPEFALADRLARGDVRGAWRLVRRFPNIAYHPSPRVKARLLRDFAVLPLLPYGVERRLRRGAARAELPYYLAPEWTDWALDSIDPRPWRGLEGPRWWAFRADWLIRRASAIGGAEGVLRAARLARMIQRNPLLDLELVDWTLGVPPEETFDPAHTRPVLRRALDGLVPDSVRLRPEKVTFDAVRGLSLREDLPVVRKLLVDPRARIRRYTRDEVVRGLVDQEPRTWDELSVWSGFVMRLVVVESWLRAQEDDGFARRMLESGGLRPSYLDVRRGASAVRA
jgi:asparagine synthase (glutamine-hydrolysing)